ncbi:hypothetical protein F4824DRAFT_449760 [Ustulina deusta]|nr:hypothetical protein F4823DRAFT_572757 [Ustulina deusta]KAI3341706.1 hypothetical protein F4824DRAFT_449760 [Ustulina deusta]
MLASILLFSLTALTAAVPASALPQDQQHGGLVKRQNTATIPTFSFGPSSTVLLGGGAATNATSSTKQASATDTSSRTATRSLVVTSSSAESEASSTTAADTGSATGTIPTYNFFPSSTVPVSPVTTSQPAAGNGTNDQDGNQAGNNGGENNTGGNKTGNGTADGTGDNGETDGESNLQDLADLLQGLLDLLGN